MVSIKKNIRQINALVQRNIFLDTRYKTNLIPRFLNPLIQIAVLLLIFGTFFTVTEDYNLGYWNYYNFTLFLFLAYTFQLMLGIMSAFPYSLINEKFWKTLQALMIAPIHRFNLLFGILISEWILISIPFIFFITVCYILFPISLLSFLFILFLFFCLSIFFASLGLFLGVVSMSNEGYYSVLFFLLRFIFWLSCITYPLGIFPEIFQNIMLLNPLFYLFDTIRLIWLSGIDINLALNFLSPIHFIVFFSLILLSPIISIYFFNIFYKKFGISGY